MVVLNVRQYLSQNGKIPQRIKETSKALKLHRHIVERIIKREFVQKIKRGDNLKTRIKLSGVDNYWKSLIRQAVYGFIVKKLHQVFMPSYSEFLKAKIMNFVTNVHHYSTSYKNLVSNIRNVINVALSWENEDYCVEVQIFTRNRLDRLLR